MMILNLTQHAATDDQIAAGVTEPDADSKAQIQRLLRHVCFLAAIRSPEER